MSADHISDIMVTQQLEQSQGQFSLIYNGAIDPMWLIGVEGENRFRFENINDAFTQVTGLKREQVIGLLMEEVLPVSSHKLVRDKYNEALLTGKVIDYIEVAVHPAGEKVGEIRVIPVKNDKGKITKLVGIANDITEKHILQKKLDNEREQLQKKITAAVIKSQELERDAISRELHDNVNQVLTTVKLYTELCTDGKADLNTYLPKCTLLLNNTINEIRALSRQLQSPALKTTSLEGALKDLVDSVQDTQMVDLQLDIPGLYCTTIDEDLQLAIYRIAQEQLNNILKHARASKVVIKFQCTNSLISLIITDDGIGFDPKQKTGGLGITNMQSRVNLFGGQFHLKSSKGKGCTMTVSFSVVCTNGKYEKIKK